MAVRVTSMLALMASLATAQAWVRLGGPVHHAPFPEIVTDDARRRLTLCDMAGDTWEWDGSAWRQLPTPHRAGPARLCHDPVRRRTLRLAGSSVSLAQDEWDGHAWTPMVTGLIPAESGPMAYDPNRRRVVLVQPSARSVVEWDGQVWVQVGATGSAPVQPGSLLVHDSARGLVLLLTSPGWGQALQTWSWDGSTWQLLATGGPDTAYLACADDRARGRVVAHGGAIAPGDTWEWDGTQWSNVQSGGPLRRHGHALAFDPVRRQVLAFGGLEGMIRPTLDAWAWNGATWQQVTGPAEPPSRRSAALAYDGSRDRLVMFGGSSSLGPTSETWEWDGVRWRDVTPSAGPGLREAAALAFDAARGHLLLFGGAGSVHAGDFWRWDGAAWRQIAVPGPPARSQHGMVFDTGRSRIVLHGGLGGTGVLGDTWEWDGVRWQQVATGGPASSGKVLMVYDHAGHSLLHRFNGETWSWDGVAWTQRGPGIQRQVYALGYDPTLQQPVAAVRPALLQGYFETWSWNGSVWAPLPGGSWPYLGRLDLGLDMALDTARGRLLAHTGTHLWALGGQPATADDLGRACPGAAGDPPFLASFGLPRGGDLGYRLDLRAGALAPAAVGLAATMTTVGLGPNCTWFLGPAAFLFAVTDVRGNAGIGVPIPADPSLRGLRVFAQMAALAPAASRGFVLSQALSLRLGD